MRSGWLMTVACGVAVMAALVGPTMAQYSGGSGDPNDPWQIADPNDLIAMGQNTQHYGDHFILTGDIDMAGAGPEPDGSFTTAVIAPDKDPNGGFQEVAFTGRFDGAGHVIRNFQIDDGGANLGSLGLFGYVDGGEIKSLGLEGGWVRGGFGEVGSLVGACWRGTISSCYAILEVNGNYGCGGLIGAAVESTISSCYATGEVIGGNKTGGLIGWTRNTAVSSCYATGRVTGDSRVGGLVGEGGENDTWTSCYAIGAVNGDRFVGGLAGHTLGAVTSCYATGVVIAQQDLVGGLLGTAYGVVSLSHATEDVRGGDYSVGGLVGWLSGEVTSCYATGEVTGSKADVGGLVGTANWGSSVTSSHATGAADGVSGVGGLVGNNEGTVTSSHATGTARASRAVGGLVGTNDGTVSSSYATGSVHGGSHTGGLLGYSDGSVSYCSASGPVRGTEYVGGLTGFSTMPTWSCFATGEVIGDTDVGGLVGYHRSTVMSCYATGSVTGQENVGGLVGNNIGSVAGCYSSGLVSGASNAGWLVGENYSFSGTVESCYALESAGPDNGHGTPLSAAAMRQQTSFAGWDFVGAGDGDAETWRIFERFTYPFLSWQDMTPVLVGSEPAADGILAKARNNVILLTFSLPITLPIAPPITIAPLAVGDDIGGQFVYSVEPDGVTLRAVEDGAMLTNHTWYRISPAAGFDVTPFAFEACTLIGDADGNGTVLVGDLGMIWSQNAQITDGCCDINGDGQVLAADLGLAWSHNAETVPAKP